MNHLKTSQKPTPKLLSFKKTVIFNLVCEGVMTPNLLLFPKENREKLLPCLPRKVLLLEAI